MISRICVAKQCEQRLVMAEHPNEHETLPYTEFVENVRRNANEHLMQELNRQVEQLRLFQQSINQDLSLRLELIDAIKDAGQSQPQQLNLLVLLANKGPNELLKHLNTLGGVENLIRTITEYQNLVRKKDEQIGQLMRAESIAEPPQSLIVQRQVFRWSQALRASKNTLLRSTLTRCDESQWECAAWLTFAEPPISKEEVVFKCRFPVIASGDVAIGVCHRNKLQGTKFVIGHEMEQIGHGCYLMCSKGRIYSHLDSKINSKKVGFAFAANEVITLSISDSTLKFSSGSNSYTMRLIMDRDPLYLAVQFTGRGDQAEILI